MVVEVLEYGARGLEFESHIWQVQGALFVMGMWGNGRERWWNVMEWSRSGEKVGKKVGGKMGEHVQYIQKRGGDDRGYYCVFYTVGP
nr:hypothetical protein [Tanacetum cinerariifolium]